MQAISHIDILPFRIERKPANWGAFFLTRLLIGLKAIGGSIFAQVSFNVTKYTVILIAFILDLLTLILWLCKIIIVWFFKGTVKQGNKAIEELMKLFIRKILFILFLVALLFAIIKYFTPIISYVLSI